jgi:hypothetical protein
MTPHHPAQRLERMRGHRETALVMNDSDRLPRGQAGRHPLGQVEPDQVAVQRADLLADHHVHAELGMLARVVAGPQRPGHPVVVRDGHHVEPAGRREHDGLRRLPAIAVERVHVQVRASSTPSIPAYRAWRDGVAHHRQHARRVLITCASAREVSVTAGGSAGPFRGGTDRSGRWRLDGQGEADGGAALLRALDAELTAVGHHQVLDDGQAEPGAAQLARSGSVDAIEALGDAR